MLSKLTFLPLFAVGMFAAEPFDVWNADDLKAMTAGKSLGQYGNHSTSVSFRDKDGVAELHEKQTDIFVVQSGEATLVLGGTVADPTSPSSGEVRGSAIKGGTKKQLKPGDIVHIPPKTPHQFFLAPGKTITYFVVKVNAE